MFELLEPLVHESLRKPLHYDLRTAMSNAGVNTTGFPLIQLSAYNMTFEPPFEDKSGYWYLGAMTLEIGNPACEAEVKLANNFQTLAFFLYQQLRGRVAISQIPTAAQLINFVATGYHALTRAMDKQRR